MKLAVFDVEGTIFKTHDIKGHEHASYIWTRIADELGEDARFEEILSQKRWRNRSWLGVEDLDLAAFDLEDINFRLRKLPRIYADIYERDLAPSRASEKLIARKYKEKG